jgi:hypothetical protein
MLIDKFTSREDIESSRKRKSSKRKKNSKWGIISMMEDKMKKTKSEKCK